MPKLKYTMSPARKLRDIKQADLDKWIKVLKISMAHPTFTNAQIGELLNLSGERIRVIKKSIDGRTVQEMIELKNKVNPE